MNRSKNNPLWGDFLEGRITRSQMLKAALAAGLTVMAVPAVAGAQTTSASGRQTYTEFPFFPQVTNGSYTTETVEEIVSNILTWAYAEVSVATLILSAPAIGNIVGTTSGLPLAFLQAFNVELQSHIDFWSGAVPGATPKATTFTLDPSIAPNAKAALGVFELAATIRSGLMITAVREFAELGQPTLAKNAAQTLGMYAEERAIARTFEAVAGVPTAVPPNNKAFETDLFLYTRDAVAMLYGLGFIGGKGIAAPYPGRVAALAASGAGANAVIQRFPNNASSTVTVTGPASLLAERT